MKTILLVFVLIALSMCRAEQYTDKYDNIDIDEILENRRLLVPYIKCILEQARCTPEGKELKLHIKDGMQTGCQKCTPKQRTSARKSVKHIREKETEYWKQIVNKYDPNDEYKEIYERFLAEED